MVGDLSDSIPCHVAWSPTGLYKSSPSRCKARAAYPERAPSAKEQTEKKEDGKEKKEEANDGDRDS